MFDRLSERLQRQKFGALIRVFAKDPKDAPKRKEQALELARKLTSFDHAGKNVFGKVLILVPTDYRRVDHDYGGTASLINESVERGERIEVINCGVHDLFCGALNLGMSKLHRAGCDYGLVISGEAADFVDYNFMNQACIYFMQGAKVVGMAINEMRELVEAGAIANTCALWDIEALQAVGGFDRCAEQPYGPNAKHDSPFTDERIVGWSQASDGDCVRIYPKAGVEEIVPLVRLLRDHGPCFGVVTPPAGAVWELPSEPAALERHFSKMANKIGRMEWMARNVNAELSFLKAGVLDSLEEKAA